MTAYGVLSRGLLGGRWSTAREGERDFRAAARFQGENLAHNLALVDALRAIADEKGSNPAQVAIAWALSRGGDIVPLIGARKRTQLQDALQAIEMQLTVNDIARIEAAVPAGAAAGERYPAAQMAHLDSEQGRGHLTGSDRAGSAMVSVQAPYSARI